MFTEPTALGNLIGSDKLVAYIQLCGISFPLATAFLVKLRLVGEG